MSWNSHSMPSRKLQPKHQSSATRIQKLTLFGHRHKCPWYWSSVVSQIQNGQERVVAYYNCILDRPQRNYWVTRQELLAVVKSIHHFHHYPYGRQFTIRTYHAALRWLLNFCNQGQIAHWIKHLQHHNFQTEHTPGARHGNADALSRCPCLT